MNWKKGDIAEMQWDMRHKTGIPLGDSVVNVVVESTEGREVVVAIAPVDQQVHTSGKLVATFFNTECPEVRWIFDRKTGKQIAGTKFLYDAVIRKPVKATEN